MLAELKKITKFYGEKGAGNFSLILDEVTMAIGEHESIAITGPSGSGKSTLLNILGTLDHPSSGEVILNETGVNLFDENGLAAIRSRFIGFVFQQHYLLPQLTLLENILLPLVPVRDKGKREEAAIRARRLIQRVGLANHSHRLPGMLSVGECQRAAVIRALVNQPRLLLADEPTGSLDAANAASLGQLLRELNREENLALVVVTHSPEIAALMQKRYRLSAGKLQPIDA